MWGTTHCKWDLTTHKCVFCSIFHNYFVCNERHLYFSVKLDESNNIWSRNCIVNKTVAESALSWGVCFGLRLGCASSSPRLRLVWFLSKANDSAQSGRGDSLIYDKHIEETPMRFGCQEPRLSLCLLQRRKKITGNFKLNKFQTFVKHEVGRNDYKCICY